ncbi:RNA polymerase sigma factor [Nocardioides hankookensis]|uniref:RNA polymerase sigma factor n=1 Tax=Nocardioides hankookensis TaxID=443157 RepID=A0ABW1LI40_9ACTN
MTVDPDGLLARTLREESGLLVARLSRRFGDFDLAEEAVQTAVVEALTTWRRAGAPDRPGAWLQVAAERNALDAVRRSSRQQALAERAPAPAAPGDGTDERLPLLFACCHPALAPEARLALTLRAVVGLTTPQIARAFLVNETALAQRIVRAKRKIVTAGITLTVPPPDQLTERLGDVLRVVYVMFNEGFVSSTGPTQDRDLAADAVWLSGVVATSLPREAEAWGLAALLTLQHARAGARFDAQGGLVLLRDQDRTAWDPTAVAAGEDLLERAAALRSPGRYQLQAALAACHTSAPTWAETDWLQIVTLYDLLLAYDASPVVRLNRAVARAQLGPDQAAAALVEVDALAAELTSYHLFHATRGQLLAGLGRREEADAAHRRALELTTNAAERRLLLTRLHRHPLEDGS